MSRSWPFAAPLLKTLLVFLCLVLAFLLVVYIECIYDFASIKPGMTRVEVEKLFPIDGGLQTSSHVRFTHPRSFHFKVYVEFSCKRDAVGRTMKSPNDRVTYVSLPHFGQLISD